MKIATVQSELFQISAYREMFDAVRQFSELDLVLVRVETDEVISGEGFTYSVIPHGASEICSIAGWDRRARGGITEWLKIAHMADCYNMQVSPHFMMELHLPLVTAIPNGLFVEYIPLLGWGA